MKNVISKTLVASAISTAMLAGAVQADVTLVSWGGGYSASQQKAYVDTYSSGTVNMISYNGGLGEVRAQVESGNVQWDIVDVLPSQARTGCDEGLFEELLQGNTALSELNNMQALCDLLNTSFTNMPVPQDQEVVDPKHPVSVWQQDKGSADLF